LTCGRYFYSVVVACQPSQKGAERLVLSIPFTVWTPFHASVAPPAFPSLSASPTPNSTTNSGRVKLGTCQAVAHSVGLPFHATIDEIREPLGKVAVNNPRSNFQDVKTVRISNSQGHPCCLLTAVGMTRMYPGQRLNIFLDFPLQQSEEKYDEQQIWVPCHKVSCQLQGIEWALREDHQIKHRARFREFDEYEEDVYFGYTDLVKTETKCILNLTVEKARAQNQKENLRLELPIEVVHGPTVMELRLLEEDDPGPTLQELLTPKGHVPETDWRKPASFQTKDVHQDLKTLAVVLADDWKLLDREDEQEEDDCSQ